MLIAATSKADKTAATLGGRSEPDEGRRGWNKEERARASERALYRQKVNARVIRELV